jgi:hypothetical protein
VVGIFKMLLKSIMHFLIEKAKAVLLHATKALGGEEL